MVSNIQLQRQLAVSGASKPVEIPRVQDFDRELKGKDLKQEMVEASHRLNEEMKRLGKNINFSYSDEINGFVVMVREGLNRGEGRVIREIPSQESIQLMKKMHDVVGLIFDKRV